MSIFCQPLALHYIEILQWGGRKGLRWCGFALFLVRFCGNFYFNSRYCGFKTLSGLRLLQPLSRGFRWKKVSAVITLFRTVGIRLFCKREPSVLFYNASGLMWLTVLANDASTSWNSMPDVSSYSRTASCSRCFDLMRDNGNWGRRHRNWKRRGRNN